jgi:hypothetical protein
MSASWPYKGWKTIDANKNDVATQDELGPRLRDCDIVGSAVLTTLPSNAERRMGMQMPTKHLQNPTPLTHSSPGPFSSEDWSVVDDEDDGIGDPRIDEL